MKRLLWVALLLGGASKSLSAEEKGTMSCDQIGKESFCTDIGPNAKNRDKIPKECVGPQAKFSKASCPTAQRVGTCKSHAVGAKEAPFGPPRASLQKSQTL
jgi:hypothetical protein